MIDDVPVRTSKFDFELPGKMIASMAQSRMYDCLKKSGLGALQPEGYFKAEAGKRIGAVRLKDMPTALATTATPAGAEVGIRTSSIDGLPKGSFSDANARQLVACAASSTIVQQDIAQLIRNDHFIPITGSPTFKP